MVRSEVLARSAALGVTAGMRSVLPLAALSAAAGDGLVSLRRPPFRVLGTPNARLVTGLLAAGEMVVDLLPFTPDRTNPGPWLGRIALGAVDGYLVGVAAGEDEILSAAVAGLTAAASTYLFHALRAGVNRTGMPNILSGLSEDALAVGMALVATRAGQARHSPIRDRLPW